MKLVAIDPGYGRVGYAVIERENGAMTLLHSGCLETDTALAYSGRLAAVGEQVKKLIRTYNPDCVVMEKLFFAKNKKTAMQTAEVRGVCIYVSETEGKEVFEYTPNQVKSAVTGNGNADKNQVMRMVPHFVTLDTSVNRIDDEYDAIAIGITHCAAARNRAGCGR